MPFMLTPSLRSVGLAPSLPGRLSRFARLRKAQNKISNPSDLARVIKMIADEDWSGMDVDIQAQLAA